MTPDECRRSVLVLNSYTRWGLDELLALSADELAEWLRVVPLVYKRR